MDKTKQVILHCNCREELFVPGILKVVPCRWMYKGTSGCPDVPDDQQECYQMLQKEKKQR